MSVDFETIEAKESEGVFDLGEGGGAVIEAEKSRVDRLDAELDFGATEGAQEGEILRGDVVGAGFDHKADIENLGRGSCRRSSPKKIIRCRS